MSDSALYQLKDLTFSYIDNKVLDGLSLTFEEGLFHAIVGPNGCGKTTLMDLMVGVRRPDSGSIRFRGKDISAIPTRTMARQVALVPQDYRINFAFTVEEVVLMGRHPHMGRFSSPSSHDLEVVERVMETLDISRFRRKFVTQLSGGERQRVVFARALAQDTRVLLMDEATSNMDIYHTIGCLSLVREAVDTEGKTAIATFHDLNTAALFCNAMLYMDSGRVVRKGSLDEVFDDKTIEEVFGVECLVFETPYLHRRRNSAVRQVVFKA